MLTVEGSPTVLCPPVSDKAEAIVDVSYSPLETIFCVLTHLSLQFWSGLEHTLLLAKVPIPRCSLLPGRDVAANVFWHSSGKRVAVTTVDRRIVIYEADIVIPDNSAAVQYRPDARQLRIVNGASRVAYSSEVQLEHGLLVSVVSTYRYLFAATSGGAFIAVNWFNGTIELVATASTLINAILNEKFMPLICESAAVVKTNATIRSEPVVGTTAAATSTVSGTPQRYASLPHHRPLAPTPTTYSNSSRSGVHTTTTATTTSSSTPQHKIRGNITALAYSGDTRTLALSFSDGHLLLTTVEVVSGTEPRHARSSAAIDFSSARMGGDRDERMLSIRLLCEPTQLSPLVVGSSSHMSAGTLQPSPSSAHHHRHAAHLLEGGATSPVIHMALSGGTSQRLLAVADNTDNSVKMYRLPSLVIESEERTWRSEDSSSDDRPNEEGRTDERRGKETCDERGDGSGAEIHQLCPSLLNRSQNCPPSSHPHPFRLMVAHRVAIPSFVETSGQSFTDEPIADLRKIAGLKWCTNLSPSTAVRGEHHSAAVGTVGNATDARSLTLCVHFAHQGFAFVDSTGAVTMTSFSRFSGCGVGVRGVPKLFSGACPSVAWGCYNTRLLAVDGLTNTLLSFNLLKPASFPSPKERASVDGDGGSPLVLLSADSLFFFQGTSVDSDATSDSWEVASAPRHYLGTNYPLRFAAVSPCGEHVCVAGRSWGFALFSKASRRWKTFGDGGGGRSGGGFLTSGGSGGEGKVFMGAGGGGAKTSAIVCVGPPHWLTSAIVAVPVRKVTQKAFAVLLYSRSSPDGGASSLLAEIPTQARCAYMASCSRLRAKERREQESEEGDSNFPLKQTAPYALSADDAMASSAQRLALGILDVNNVLTLAEVVVFPEYTTAAGGGNTMNVAKAATRGGGSVSLYQLCTADLTALGVSAPVKMELIPSLSPTSPSPDSQQGATNGKSTGRELLPKGAAKHLPSLLVLCADTASLSLIDLDAHAAAREEVSVKLSSSRQSAADREDEEENAVLKVLVAAESVVCVPFCASADEDTGVPRGAPSTLLNNYLTSSSPLRMSSGRSPTFPSLSLNAPQTQPQAATSTMINSSSSSLLRLTGVVSNDMGGIATYPPLSRSVHKSRQESVRGRRAADSEGITLAADGPEVFGINDVSLRYVCSFDAAIVYDFWVDLSSVQSVPNGDGGSQQDTDWCPLITSGPRGLWMQPLPLPKNRNRGLGTSASVALPSSSTRLEERRNVLRPLLLPRGYQICEFDPENVPLCVFPHEGHVLFVSSAVDRQLLMSGMFPLYAPAVRPQLYHHLTLLRLLISVSSGGGVSQRHTETKAVRGNNNVHDSPTSNAQTNPSPKMETGCTNNQSNCSNTNRETILGKSTRVDNVMRIKSTSQGWLESQRQCLLEPLPGLWALLKSLRSHDTLAQTFDYLLFTAIHHSHDLFSSENSYDETDALYMYDEDASIFPRSAADRIRGGMSGADAQARVESNQEHCETTEAHNEAPAETEKSSSVFSFVALARASIASSPFTFVNISTSTPHVLTGDAGTPNRTGSVFSARKEVPLVAATKGSPRFDDNAADEGRIRRDEEDATNARRLKLRSLMRSALTVLKAFPEEYHAVVTSCVRKVDMSKWPLIFDATVGSPQSFFEQCLRKGYAREAAQMVRVVLMGEEWEDDDEDEDKEKSGGSSPLGIHRQQKGREQSAATLQKQQRHNANVKGSEEADADASKRALERALSCAKRLFVAAIDEREDVPLAYEVLRFMAMLSMEVDLPPVSPPETIPTSVIERAMRSLLGGSPSSSPSPAGAGIQSSKATAPPVEKPNSKSNNNNAIAFAYDPSSMVPIAALSPVAEKTSLLTNTIQKNASALGGHEVSATTMTATAPAQRTKAKGVAATTTSPWDLQKEVGEAVGDPLRVEEVEENAAVRTTYLEYFLGEDCHRPANTLRSTSVSDCHSLACSFLSPAHIFIDEDGVDRPEMAPTLCRLLTRPGNNKLCAAVVTVAARALCEGKVTLLFTLFDVLSLDLLHFIPRAWPLVRPCSKLDIILARLHEEFGLPRGEREVGELMAELTLKRCPELFDDGNEPARKDNEEVGIEREEEGRIRRLKEKSPFFLVTATQERISYNKKTLGALRALEKVFLSNGCDLYVAAFAILLPNPYRLAQLTTPILGSGLSPSPYRISSLQPCCPLSNDPCVASSYNTNQFLFNEVLRVLSSPSYCGYARLREEWKRHLDVRKERIHAGDMRAGVPGGSSTQLQLHHQFGISPTSISVSPFSTPTPSSM